MDTLLKNGATVLGTEHGCKAAERTHESVVQMFIERPGLFTKEEIITAIELMCASFANDKNNNNVTKAHTHLMTAMEMRYEASFG